MRQLITRLDDDLHERLKARAAAEGRSVNSLVVGLITEFVSRQDGAVDAKERLRRRAEAAGLLVVPREPAEVLSRDEAIACTRGLGRAASQALAAERAAR